MGLRGHQRHPGSYLVVERRTSSVGRRTRRLDASQWPSFFLFFWVSQVSVYAQRDKEARQEEGWPGTWNMVGSK